MDRMTWVLVGGALLLPLALTWLLCELVRLIYWQGHDEGYARGYSQGKDAQLVAQRLPPAIRLLSEVFGDEVSA